MSGFFIFGKSGPDMKAADGITSTHRKRKEIDLSTPDVSALLKVPEIRDTYTELLREQLREKRAEAEMAEIQLAVTRDQERDRQVRNGLLRRLPITGPIQGQSIEHWIEALEHWEARDPGEPVQVIIDSPGGDVLGGMALYDTILRLRRKGHPVTTRGRGMVASMAGILLQAGDERVLDENAQLMIHEVSFGTRGKMSEVEDMASFVAKLQKRLLAILAERSTMSERQIATKWKKTDWWLSADEALKLGFVDRVE